MPCFCFSSKRNRDSLDAQTIAAVEEISNIPNVRLYSYEELRKATENFRSGNKLGQGGFGSVYKGRLGNGTLGAIKVLSMDSRQGMREFLAEINVISVINHDNLVTLHGCCVEGQHRILVYPYLENSSLDKMLFGRGHGNIQLNWQTRCKICIGIAQGLAFLHEEVQPHVIHRDIKASNILLDKDLTPKISDFGLARLLPAHLTHVSTRVAGTTGYLAPEFAIRGQATRRTDIYSFGVLLLEIVCGRYNINRRFPAEEPYLLEMVWEHHEKGQLLELVDLSLHGDYGTEEACRYLKVGLLCTQDMPKLRPSMSTVVKMLTGDIDISDQTISRPGMLSEFMLRKDVLCKKGELTTEDSGKPIDLETMICPTAPPGNREAALKVLQSRNVELLLGYIVRSIQRVDDAETSEKPNNNRPSQGTQSDLASSRYELELQPAERGSQGRTLEADLVLWTVGSKSLLQTLEPSENYRKQLPLNARGQAETDETLRVKGHPRIFALGDSSALRDSNGRLLPATAQVAFQQADFAGWNLWAAINNRPLLPFRYQNLGEMMTLGRNDASVSPSFIEGLTLEGPIGHAARKIAYLIRLPTDEHRVKVGISWLTKSAVDSIASIQTTLSTVFTAQ